AWLHCRPRVHAAPPQWGWRGAPGRLNGSAPETIRPSLMTDPLAPSPLPMPMFSSSAMRGVVDGRARLQRMLDFEAALARAAAAVGAIPPAAADPLVHPPNPPPSDLPPLPPP